MMEEVAKHIPNEVVRFISSRNCCQQFCTSFRPTDREVFSKYAEALGFVTRNYIENGIESIKVYKRGCTHYMEAETLVIQRESAKELFLLFHTHLHNDFIGRVQEMQVSPDFYSPGISACPTVAPVRFSQCAFTQSMAKLSTTKSQAIPERLRSYRESILNAVESQRLLIVNGNSHCKKSTMIPMFLLEDCILKGQHCKIICIELNRLLAEFNCELLAKNMGEKLGEKIGYQVNGQSLISSTSNVIYTTASFFLRYLMGQNIPESLLHVTHILVNDVHIRDAYFDILLGEIREAMQCYPELRILLLSDSKDNSFYLKYFNFGKELQLDSKVIFPNITLKSPQIFYIEEIRQVVSEKCPKPIVDTSIPSVMREVNCNQKCLDNCLDNYEQEGTDAAFEAFLYLVNGECACFDYRHSVTGLTALMIAAKLGKAYHVHVLLKNHADPFITDERNQTALQKALTAQHSQCIELLSAYEKTIKDTFNDADPAFFDSALISDLICLITTYPAWSDGNILIFVSNYEQLVRINFSILRLKVVGKLPQQIAIRVLHDDMSKEEVNDLICYISNGMNIIITTSFGEIFHHLKSVKYVVDSARTSFQMYNSDGNCNENIYRWNSQESIDHRTMFIDQNTNSTGICFRLLPRSLYNQLPSLNIPELLTMPLERICLTVKLLSPHTLLAEYFQRTIAKPPLHHINSTVESLKKINVFDNFEDITWLGCRLIDIPIDCHLGKLLIFGIMLHCFDPILTITSFLCKKDPLNLPKKTECPKKNHINTIRYKVKEERNRLAENCFSDHLVYLRLYQEWENGIPEDTNIDLPLTDEHDFVVKALLENVALTRAKLVGALRTAQLIHNQGPMNMYSLNKNSSNWAMIKAALVGALYPKICMIDASVYSIKSGRCRNLNIYPSSVLRDLAVEPLCASSQRFCSPWIVFSNEMYSITCNSVEGCTLVAPLSIVLFAGPPKMFSDNIKTYKVSENLTKSREKSTLKPDSLVSNFYIDEWLWFTLDATDAQLLFKTRQLFYSIYNNYLQNCINMEKMRTSHAMIKQLPRLLECIAKVLLNEDINYGFAQPKNIGERPRAKQNQFLHAHNLRFGSCNKLFRTDYLPKVMQKQYFIVSCPDTIEMGCGNSMIEWLRKAVSKIVAPQLSPDTLTYVITYQRSPDQFRSVCTAFLELEKFQIKECFRNSIPIFELINICLNNNIYLPSFNGRHMPFRIENQVGEILLDLFAYRYICFYNY